MVLPGTGSVPKLAAPASVAIHPVYPTHPISYLDLNIFTGTTDRRQHRWSAFARCTPVSHRIASNTLVLKPVACSFTIFSTACSVAALTISGASPLKNPPTKPFLRYSSRTMAITDLSPFGTPPLQCGRAPSAAVRPMVARVLTFKAGNVMHVASARAVQPRAKALLAPSSPSGTPIIVTRRSSSKMASVSPCRHELRKQAPRPRQKEPIPPRTHTHTHRQHSRAQRSGPYVACVAATCVP